MRRREATRNANLSRHERVFKAPGVDRARSHAGLGQWQGSVRHLRLDVPAVHDDLRATAVPDEVLEVYASSLDLREGVVKDDVNIAEDRL